MMQPKAEMFEGMDGHAEILGNVMQHQHELPEAGYYETGDGIDAAIALILNVADDYDGAARHCDYVINELDKFRANIRMRKGAE